jgi:hypothetical protein
VSAFAFEYADVSEDPNASSWADIPTVLRREIGRLDFVQLGYAHAWHRKHHAHLVHEVFVSADARTQAVVHAQAPHVELITLFGDGSIVKTQQRPPTSTWVLMAPGMGAHRADGLLFESVDGDASTMVRRHEERVRVHELAANVPTVRMDSMQAHFAVRLRAAELLNARFPLQFGLAIALAFATQVVGSYFVLSFARSRLGPDAPRLWLALLAALGGTIAALGVFQLVLYWAAPYGLRWARPGPPRVGATTLLERAAEVPRRMLPTDPFG